jgi:glycosyltransferase involved in cell wall biosynthesis
MDATAVAVGGRSLQGERTAFFVAAPVDGPLMTSADRERKELRVLARPAFKDGVKKPYNFLLYGALQRLGVKVSEYEARRLLQGHVDIWHVHWPESLIETRSELRAWLSAQQYRLLLHLARRQGIKLIWTIHDLVPHDLVYPRIEWAFWHDVIDRVDAVIALTRNGLDVAREKYPRLQTCPAFVIPHGHFRDAYPRTVSREEARGILGISPEKRVIAYFGQIRPYKNVPRLVQVFRSLPGDDLMLLICGRISKRTGGRQEIVAAAEGDPRIRLELRYIKPEEIQVFLLAADLMVFPYSEILNSGSAILALSYDRPVVAPNLGALPELRTLVGDAWMRGYEGDIDARILADSLAWALQTERPPRAPLEDLDWTKIGAQTLDAYWAVVRNGQNNAAATKDGPLRGTGTNASP